MKSKHILILSFFSFLISLTLILSYVIIYKIPEFSIENSRKQKILEFTNPSKLNFYLTKLTFEKQDSIEQLWKYKKLIDNEIIYNKKVKAKELKLDSNSYVKVFLKENLIIKVEHYFKFKDRKDEMFYYVKNHKIILYHIVSQNLPNKNIIQVLDFISNDNLLYESRTPNNCVLVEENYCYSIVKQINKQYIYLIDKFK